MAETKLEIDLRCERIEAAIGHIADNMGEGEVVRTILYGESRKVVGGGGEPRGEGESMTPEEFNIAHDIAERHHALYRDLAVRYGHYPQTPISWEDMANSQKQLLVGIMAKMLDEGIIKAG